MDARDRGAQRIQSFRYEPGTFATRTPIVRARFGHNAALAETAGVSDALLRGLDHRAHSRLTDVVVMHDVGDVANARGSARVLLALQKNLVPVAIGVFLTDDLGDADAIVDCLRAE